ncbi:alpha/beta hydrolase [Mycobacterium sp. MYCO198283]|uniref:alpha/beta hydrolase n=1 Tax=Mycobacterium sp. MYCO198283 TaxID=2883505 RepID=UPI0035ABBC34
MVDDVVFYGSPGLEILNSSQLDVESDSVSVMRDPCRLRQADISVTPSTRRVPGTGASPPPRAATPGSSER